MKTRTMIVGPRDSGKRIIAERLEGLETPLPKVANIVYHPKTILVPDSYLESPWMHKHVIALQQSARNALFIQPVGAPHRSYPPNFARVFRIPVIGIVTYQGSYAEDALAEAERRLVDSGIPLLSGIVDLTKKEEATGIIRFLE